MYIIDVNVNKIVSMCVLWIWNLLVVSKRETLGKEYFHNCRIYSRVTALALTREVNRVTTISFIVGVSAHGSLSALKKWCWMVKVKSMQILGTEAIRTQNQPSKPKREITKITNSQNTNRTYGLPSEQPQIQSRSYLGYLKVQS